MKQVFAEKLIEFDENSQNANYQPDNAKMIIVLYEQY